MVAYTRQRCLPRTLTHTCEVLRSPNAERSRHCAAILELIPEAEEVISYRVPAFRVQGKTVAGFAAFQNHLSYLPFSGSVLPQLADELRGYK